jgi:hypothetical protein
LAILQATPCDVSDLYGVHEMTFPLSISSSIFLLLTPEAKAAEAASGSVRRINPPSSDYK